MSLLSTVHKFREARTWFMLWVCLIGTNYALHASGPTTTVSCSTGTITDNGSGAPAGTYAAICMRVYLCAPGDPIVVANNGVLSYAAEVNSDDHCYNHGYQTPTNNSSEIDIAQWGLNGNMSGSAVSLFYGRALSYRTAGTGCGGPYTSYYSGVNPLACTAPPPPPPPTCNPSGSPTQVPIQGYTWSWNYNSCSWQQVPLGPSPIVIDTNGDGFHMTSATDGVMFDFYGNGRPIQIAWTAKGSRNGWLALPNAQGTVTSARDLFGNITLQPPNQTTPPNGFAALSLYDASNRGGNSNNLIDPGDTIWRKLRVWIDDDHNGVAEPNELQTLDSLGIASINLAYHMTRYVDQFGNQFRFKGTLSATRVNDIDRKIYDVFLETKLH